ncbi:MAG: hypothetical protein AUG85_09695 [Gemmatimonadetes bacterium 13_1_20CM_4_66_11]|nr:MAG: hypothetical protein AUG85_09695 [Gemmatimonadetes bacterium 13_1_20CM_4_66_11]
MTTVVVSSFDVANYPEGGGHFWVYMQYVQALRGLGCDVWWLEQFRPWKDPDRNAQVLAAFRNRLERFGLGNRALLYAIEPTTQADARVAFLTAPPQEAQSILRRADLVLNFHYGIDPRLLSGARRTALVDIDPGLTQLWMSNGQIQVPPHDVYFTIGETVGTPDATFPDCGLTWLHIHPPVCLDLWPYVHDPRCTTFTTVAGWWSGKWVKVKEEGREVCHDNNKRIAFLAREVASSPDAYQAYIQQSRGEWSCAKPFFVKLQNAWVSDRTTCYLASGKPVVVQHTGPSDYLPHGEGMFRFRTTADAAAALDAINSDYPRHCRAAREIAEAHFDARRILSGILDTALAPATQALRA